MFSINPTQSELYLFQFLSQFLFSDSDVVAKFWQVSAI